MLSKRTHENLLRRHLHDRLHKPLERAIINPILHGDELDGVARSKEPRGRTPVQRVGPHLANVVGRAEDGHFDGERGEAEGKVEQGEGVAGTENGDEDDVGAVLRGQVHRCS